MKYLKKKKKSPLIPIVCVLGLLLLAALLVLALLPGSAGPEQKPGQTEPAASGTQPVPSTAPPETTVPAPTAPQSAQYVQVETPYCILNFPRKWESYLDVTVTEELPCRVSFVCRFSEDRSFPLFEIGFNTDQGKIQGVVDAGGANEAKVYYLPEEAVTKEDMTGEEWEIYTAMQDCAGGLIDRIPFSGDILGGNLEDVTIETPYANLTFPGKWQDYLYVQTDESEGYVLHFYAKFPDGEAARIFSLTFSRENTDGKLVDNGDGDRFWIQVDRPDLRESQLRQDRMTTALLMQEELRTVMESVSSK